MKNKILILLTRLNFIFPNYLGIPYIKYRLFFKKNQKRYNNYPRLFQIVKDSKAVVPFYKNNIPKEINEIELFRKYVPLIDKDTVMSDWNSFTSKSYSKKEIVEGTTGGTSGKPLRLIMPKNRYIFELNTLYSIWKNYGWNGHIRGVIKNKKLKDNQTCIIDPTQKQVIFDGFRTDECYYEKIYQQLRKLNIQFIQAYPSSAYQFCLFLMKHKKDVGFIKAFLLGSEGVTEFQKNLITEQLGIPICEFYGHSEKLIIGGPCKGNKAIHIEPTYGYFELINNKGEVVKNPGEIGEIVGTTLHNLYMPLIRYKTGDFAEYVGDYCPSCKRHLTLIKNIQGRWDKNKIYLADGTYISTTALNLHSDLYEHINGLQYVQHTPKLLEVHLIKGASFNKKILERFNNHFETALNGRCDFRIVFKEVIEKEPNGKFLPLKQYIKES